MSETDHQRRQREARERKHAAKIAREQANAAANRRISQFDVDKVLLLKLLYAEGLSPQGATKIIATGHREDVLSVTVAFD